MYTWRNAACSGHDCPFQNFTKIIKHISNSTVRKVVGGIADTASTVADLQAVTKIKSPVNYLRINLYRNTYTPSKKLCQYANF